MKRYHKIIRFYPLAILALVSSCNSSDSGTKVENNDSTETVEPTVYKEPEKIDIIDTLSFELNSSGKKAIEAYQALKEPSENHIYDENTLNTTQGLYEFYKGQEQFWWQKTAWAEKAKLQSIDRIIEEISFNPETKKSQLETLKKYQTKLKSLFLTRSEISDPAKIPFDDITTALLDTIVRTGESIPKMNSYQAFNALKYDVDSLHNNLQLSLRRTHIASIDSLNQFISRNKEELLKENIDTSQVDGWAY